MKVAKRRKKKKRIKLMGEELRKKVKGSELIEVLRTHFDSIDVPDGTRDDAAARLYVGNAAGSMSYIENSGISKMKFISILNNHTEEFMERKEEFLDQFSNNEYYATMVSYMMTYVVMGMECGVMSGFDHDEFSEALSQYVEKEAFSTRSSMKEFFLKRKGNQDPEVQDAIHKTFEWDLANLPYENGNYTSDEFLNDLMIRLYGAFSDAPKPPRGVSLREKSDHYSSILVESSELGIVFSEREDLREELFARAYETVNRFGEQFGFEEDLALFWGVAIMYYSIAALKEVVDKTEEASDKFYSAVSRFVYGIHGLRIKKRGSKSGAVRIVFPADFRKKILGTSIGTRESFVKEGSFVFRN